MIYCQNTVVQCEVIDGSFNDKVKVRLLQNRCDGLFFKWDKVGVSLSA